MKITTELRYDNIISQCKFSEQFTHLRGDTYVYRGYASLELDYDCLEDLFEISEENSLRKLTKALVNEDLLDYFGSFNYKSEYIDELFSHYDINDIKEFIRVLGEYGIKYETKFERTTSMGYCQGDYVEVFIPKEIRTHFGMADDVDLVDNLQKEINNLCWGAPIYGSFSVAFEYKVSRNNFNGEVVLNFEGEFKYNEYSKDYYDVKIDIDSILNTIEKVTNYNVPQETLNKIRRDLEAIDSSVVLPSY